MGAGGPQISGGLGSGYRTGLTHTFFFPAPRLLIIFLEIKDFKPAGIRARDTSRGSAITWTRPPGRSAFPEGALPAFIFRGHLSPPGGGQILGALGSGTAWQGRTFFREFPKTF